VLPIKDALIVNAGQLVHYLSNRKIRCTKHRVRLPNLEEIQSSERFSIALFVQPKLDFIVKPPNSDEVGIRFDDWMHKFMSTFK
jgi:isopenicillin N synthase-like dioxygenase